VVACVDFGSTFTKAALVELPTGRLVGTASHRTTIDTDVLDGWDACRQALSAADPRAADAPVLACSSAGGGLRIAVVGNEELVTAEAGRRVALSSGGRVVHVAAGGLRRADVTELRASRPDVVLLVGGTDGGNVEVLLRSAETLAKARWRTPVVVAGNVDAREDVAALLDAAGTTYVLADNVVPQIGVLAPDSARAAIREMFLRHVIGGKHLSRRRDSSTGSGRRFIDMVQGATPDVVLTAVELLARGLDLDRPGVGDVVVVDVGGATTDVHSVVEVDPEDSGLSREVVATVPVTRTVEGDLGMRWSAVSTVDAAVEAGLVSAELTAAAKSRQEDPGFVAAEPRELETDREIAAAAVMLALRRHAGRSQVVYGPGTGGPGRVVERSGKDLREVRLLVGSGGVLRHADDTAADLLTRHLHLDSGWQLPEHPRTVVDQDYVLAAAGLLASRHPDAAYALLRTLW
jgi:uncharacterized protein (TIGR01319 family)